MPLLNVEAASTLPQPDAVLYVCIGACSGDSDDGSGVLCSCLMDPYYPFDRAPPVGATYTHVTTDRKHLLMCQINTSALTTVGDDHGGISTTDVVLPSSARGQFTQSSFVFVSIAVTKRPNGTETVVLKNSVAHNKY
jgi:hypothetical protein